MCNCVAAILSPLPVRAAVERVRKFAELTFFGDIALEVHGSRQCASQK
jgi:hypothetical protein